MRVVKGLLFAAGVAAVLLIAPRVASAQWEGMTEQQLQADAQARGRTVGRCQDIWINYAFNRLTAGGIAQGDYCNISNYNSGHWNSLTELIGYVDCYSRSHFPCGDIQLSVTLQPLGGGAVRVFSVVNGQGIGTMDVANGRIVAASGGTIVAQGAGNIVAQGAGNIVAQGAGNLVVIGGNLVGNSGGTVLPSAVAGIISTNGGGAAPQRTLMSVQSIPLGVARVPTRRGKDDKRQYVDIGSKLQKVDVPKAGGKQQ